MGGVEHVFLCVFLFGAGWSDLYNRKVKNWWLALWAAAGIFCGRTEFIFSAAVMLFLVFWLFLMGMLGAGDGKMMAVIAGYLGFWNGFYAVGTGMMIGALWSLYRLWHSRSFRTRLIYLSAYFWRMLHTKEIISYENADEKDSGRTIPLAACMAVGTYLYLLGSWMRIMGQTV